MLPYISFKEAETALGRSLTTTETLWFDYTSNMSDYMIYCHNIPLNFLVTTLIPLFYLVMEHMFPDYAQSYKIQPKVKFTLYDNIKCYFVVMRPFFFLEVPLLLVSYPSIEMIGIRTSLPLPSLIEVISQLVVYFVIEDYTNYWLHRLFHTKWLYENIHKVHHEYTTPIAVATQHAHWAENVIFGFPSYLGPLIVPGHMITFSLWLVLRQIEAIENHSGYDFPWVIKNFIPFTIGAEFHDYHHYVGGRSHSNFAPIFSYCDYIYGTDKGYKYHKKLQYKLRDVSEGHSNQQTGG